VLQKAIRTRTGIAFQPIPLVPGFTRNKMEQDLLGIILGCEYWYLYGDGNRHFISVHRGACGGYNGPDQFVHLFILFEALHFF
jgi:hypothetical protein